MNNKKVLYRVRSYISRYENYYVEPTREVNITMREKYPIPTHTAHKQKIS